MLSFGLVGWDNAIYLEVDLTEEIHEWLNTNCGQEYFVNWRGSQSLKNAVVVFKRSADAAAFRLTFPSKVKHEASISG